MKAGIYYRISTRDKQDIGMQEKVCKEYCERENIPVVREYKDIGVSGKKESRPEFDMMLNDIRSKNIDCVIVYKLDRIGRSLSHLVKLFEEFQKKQIKFISATQSFNTTTPEGKMMLRMMMVLAEYEREIIIARINDGLSEAKARGKKLGRPSGSKDKGRRRRSGYNQRWIEERKNKQSTPQKLPINLEVNKENIPK